MEVNQQPTPFHETPVKPQPSTGVVAALFATRQTLRRLLVIERASQFVAITLGSFVVSVFLDSLIRFPSTVRVFELILITSIMFGWFWKRVIPSIQFHPSLVQVALRVEAIHPHTAGVLAIGADLATTTQQAVGGDVSPTTQSLIDTSIAQADQVDLRIHARGINRQPAKRAMLLAACVVALCGAVLLINPGTVRIGLLRLLSPFSDVQWPARTMVESAFTTLIHPRGSALPLRCKTIRGEPNSMRVEAEYRLVKDGAGDWRTVLLAPQPDGSFERLVETDGELIEVVFRTEDMETPPVQVSLLPPPAVDSARATITPPEYARTSIDTRTVDLGNGTDRRATVSPPVLVGSTITIDLNLQGCQPPPHDPTAQTEWLTRAVKLVGDGEERITPTLIIDPENSNHWSLQWSAAGRGVLELQLEGAQGIKAIERIAFEIPAVEDSAPSVAIVEPSADQSVTPQATPLLVAEGRDDLAVKRIWIEAVVVRGNAAPQAPQSQDGEAGITARVEWKLALTSMSVQPGDRVVCVARVVDAFEINKTPRAPIASTPRVFRIISSGELTEQVRAKLGQMREAASRLREEQSGITEAVRAVAERTKSEGESATKDERGRLAPTESRLSDRVAAFERTLAELNERLEKNKTDGAGLDQSIRDASELASRAAKSAQEAAAQLADTQSAERSVEQANNALEALSDLESALQQDRATAELTRRIDKLSEKLEGVRRDTRAAAEKSVGKSKDQIPEEARDLIERSAQTQREAASEARALTEELGKRAEQIDQQGQKDQDLSKETSTADAMRQAQREAEERGLARQLEQGAKQTQENQMQAAQQSQQAAQQAVAAMQAAMKNQQKRQVEELQRKITEVVDSLRSLLAGIDSHTLPIQKLQRESVEELNTETAAVLQLARNASSIAEAAAEAGKSLQRVAVLTVRAAEQLDGTAVFLRKAPAEIPSAQSSLDAARTSVEAALAAAQQAEREAERATENRRREELRGVYQQVLERQRSARTATQGIVPAAGKQLDRRGFIESRRVSAEQSTVTGLLTTIGNRADITASELYNSSNQEMISASSLANQDLLSSSPSQRTILLQKEVEAAIASILEALADPPEPEDPFANGENGGQPPPGQQGGGSQEGPERVPPIAELRLLRNMAQRVLDDTTAATELPESDRGPYLARVAARQKRITDLGERWMKAMQQQSGGQPELKEEPTGGGSTGSKKPKEESP